MSAQNDEQVTIVIRVLAAAWAIGGRIGADFSLELRPRVLRRRRASPVSRASVLVAPRRLRKARAKVEKS